MISEIFLPNKKYKKWVYYLLILLAIFYLSNSVSSLFLKTSHIAATDNIKRWVFIFSFFLVSMGYFSFVSILKLILERRRRVLGSMIKTRLAGAFFLVTLIPVTVLTFIIAFLINIGSDIIYRKDFEEALNKSIDYIKTRRRVAAKFFRQSSRNYFRYRRGLFSDSNVKYQGFLFFQTGRLKRVELLSKDMRALAKQVVQVDSINIIGKGDGMLFLYMRLRKNKQVEYILMKPQPVFFLDNIMLSSTLGRYRQLTILKKPMQAALIYLIAVIFVFFILLNIWATVKLAKFFFEPIKALVEGTERIAFGDLDFRVEAKSRDEFKILIKNFNRMTNALQMSQQRLFYAEKIAAWREVAKRLAHEIKNPLTPIRLSAERVLRQSRKKTENIHEIIERSLPSIILEVETIQNLLNEFSAFARMPKKREAKIDLNNFVKMIVIPFQELHHDISFEVSYLDKEITVLLDVEQIRRVLRNLIQNSINALENKKNKRIKFALEYGHKFAKFILSDNGKGIAPDAQSKIFNAYFSNSKNGTGLGLSIVKKIIEDHNGKIGFESELGVGTTFFIEIPQEKEMID